VENLGGFCEAIKKVSRLNMFAAISAFVSAKAWMPGTGPGITGKGALAPYPPSDSYTLG